MPLISPATAALVLGLSRQAVSKQKARLNATGQACMVDGRWAIRSERLLSWWIGNCRTGPSWDRLARVRRLLGPEPEPVLMAHGGLEQLGEMLGVVGLLAPGRRIETDGLMVEQTDGGWRPLIETVADWLERIEAHRQRTGGLELDEETGQIATAAGPVMVWELEEVGP